MRSNGDVGVPSNRNLQVAGLAMLCVVFCGCAGSGKDSIQTSIPRIANIAKIQVGYSTQQDLAKQWGEGIVITGGHPNSGRVWRVSGTQWVVHTDGFEYSDRGLVVDALTLDEGGDRASSIGAPAARLGKDDFLWLGEVSLGMSKGKLTEILKCESLPVTPTEHGLEIRAGGFHSLVGVEFKTWTVAFDFTNDSLSRLTLNAMQSP